MSMWGKICHILFFRCLGRLGGRHHLDIQLLTIYFFVVDIHGLHSNIQYILHVLTSLICWHKSHCNIPCLIQQPQRESPVGHFLTMFDLGCVQQSRYDLGSNWVQVGPGGKEGSQQHLWWYLVNGRKRWSMYHPTPKPKSYAISILLCERFSNVCADHESPLV